MPRSDTLRTAIGLVKIAALLSQLLLATLIVTLSAEGILPRLREPRIPPLEEKDWTPAQRELLAAVRTERGDVSNLYKTIVRYPELFGPRLEFGRYIQRESSLPARDREILICRIAWLSDGEYEWSAHSRIAVQNGLTANDVERIAKGPEARGWNQFDRALLSAADELFQNIIISDATWKTLQSRYNTQQLMDAVMTVGGYHMLAMALNSFGIPLEAGSAGFPPRSSDQKRSRPGGTGGIPARLKSPRIEPISEATWSAEERELTSTVRQERGFLPHVYATMVRNPQMYRHWIVFARHILRASSLPAREREMLICRTAWLSSGEYEWGAHTRIGKENGLTDDEIARLAAGPNANGWPAQDAVIVRAVDELYYDGFISDASWTALASRFETRQLMDLVFTVGSYKMLAMALNTFGTQLDSGMAGFSATRNQENSAARRK